MGCSSSSAQTVDQEKRPGTKPEESNGDTLAVRNGIIAEDAQTIEDQLQLPLQTALPEDYLGKDDEAEPVLVALEAQEDLGFGEDLLAASELQPEPAVTEEPAPEVPAAITEEDSAEPGAEDALVVKRELPSVKDNAPVENEVKAFVQGIGEAADVAVQESVPAVVEDVPTVVGEAISVLEPVASEQEEAAVVVEEAATLDTDVPADVAPLVENPTDSAAPEMASAAPSESITPDETLAPAATEAAPAATEAAPAATEAAPATEAAEPGEAAKSGEAAASVDASLPSESSALVEAIIDNEIAVASIPEMAPLTPETVEVQAEPQPAAEEPLGTTVDPPADTPCCTEVSSAPVAEAESAEDSPVEDASASTAETPAEVGPETPPTNVTLEPTVGITASADSEAPSAHETSPHKEVSATEASLDTNSEKTKKD